MSKIGYKDEEKRGKGRKRGVQRERQRGTKQEREQGRESGNVGGVMCAGIEEGEIRMERGMEARGRYGGKKGGWEGWRQQGREGEGGGGTLLMFE